MKDFKLKLTIPNNMNQRQFAKMKGIDPSTLGRYLFVGISPENVEKYDLYDYVKVTKEQNKFLERLGYKKEQ